MFANARSSGLFSLPYSERNNINHKINFKMEDETSTTDTAGNGIKPVVLRRRHRWNKHRYSGKYSSFEIDADCEVCGCRRKKLFMGYEYTLNGKTTYEAPACEPLA